MARSRSASITPRPASCRAKASCANYAKQPSCAGSPHRRSRNRPGRPARTPGRSWTPGDASQQEEIEVLTEQAADLRSRLERHRDKRRGLHEEVSLSRDEIQRIAQEIEIQSLEGSWQQAQAQAGRRRAGGARRCRLASNAPSWRSASASRTASSASRNQPGRQGGTGQGRGSGWCACAHHHASLRPIWSSRRQEAALRPKSIWTPERRVSPKARRPCSTPRPARPCLPRQGGGRATNRGPDAERERARCASMRLAQGQAQAVRTANGRVQQEQAHTREWKPTTSVIVATP